MKDSQIKFGFLIKNGEIYDTKIMSYELKKRVSGENIIYYMKPTYYKRLYLFEPLLTVFSIEKVFRILNFNSILRKEREKNSLDNKTHYMSNMSVIYSYPPTYLTNRKFNLYKTCQALKKKLD